MPQHLIRTVESYSFIINTIQSGEMLLNTFTMSLMIRGWKIYCLMVSTNQSSIHFHQHIILIIRRHTLDSESSSKPHNIRMLSSRGTYTRLWLDGCHAHMKDSAQFNYYYVFHIEWKTEAQEGPCGNAANNLRQRKPDCHPCGWLRKWIAFFGWIVIEFQSE